MARLALSRLSWSSRGALCALVLLSLLGGCASSVPSDPNPPGNPRMVQDLGLMQLPTPPDLLGIDLKSNLPPLDFAGSAPCQVWPQGGCPAGLKCTTYDYSTTVCDNDGTAARGATCTQGPDSCRAGSMCYRDTGNGATQCRQFCTANQDCGAKNDCVIDLNAGRTMKVCTQPCDPLVATSCASGLACYLYDAEHTDCVAAGQYALGAPCSSFFDECQAGLTCISGRCRKVCKRAGGTCDAGQTCQPIDKWVTYGVCCPSTGC